VPGSDRVAVDGQEVRGMQKLEDGQVVTTGSRSYSFHLQGGLNRLLKDPTFLAYAQDPTTGCLHRDCFLDYLEEVHTAAMDDDRAVSLMVFGVDDYSTILEAFGQEETDKVLRQLGTSIEKALRSGDHLFRNQEDQFILVLPHTISSTLNGLGRRIKKQVEETPVTLGKEMHTLTLSLSILTGPLPQEESTHHDFLNVGLAMLAQARKQGKPMAMS
jgi:diguanylate cyclase (GGDEF)-like protein